MSNLFDSKKEVQKDEFIKKWENSERERDEAGIFDSSARERLEKHRNYKGLEYYVVTLTEDGLNNLILPYHAHVNNEVNLGGEPFWKVVSKYSKRIQERETDDCLQRLCWIKRNLIGNQFNKSDGLVEVRFVFVSADRELAMPGDANYKDHGENKLYAGNFHQFVAYGVWIKENDYHPKTHKIKIYYCVKNLIAG